jgi:surface protein
MECQISEVDVFRFVLQPRPFVLGYTLNVTDMTEMFSEAVSFHQDISTWDTANVTRMKNMFANASSFSPG